ncbi:hypothetical protein ACGFYY_04200 [Streptomyces sp. NPDC048331]|uniref:hypothetical protein n=1 Tax=Streptomyces sp. NPDC048331 TaxID=3365534 RepID=UPI00371529CC
MRAFHTAADAVRDLPSGPVDAARARRLRGAGPVTTGAVPTTSPAWRPRPARAPGPAGTSQRRAPGTATCTPTGRTAAARSKRWPTRPAPWATGGPS